MGRNPTFPVGLRPICLSIYDHVSKNRRRAGAFGHDSVDIRRLLVSYRPRFPSAAATMSAISWSMGMRCGFPTQVVMAASSPDR